MHLQAMARIETPRPLPGFWLIIISCLLGTASAFAAPAESPGDDILINGKPVPDIVATVNGVGLPSLFLKSELFMFQAMKKQQGKEPTEKERADFAQKTVEEAIDKELIYQKGKKLKITVPPEIIEKEIENVRGKFPNQEVFLAALAFQKMTLDTLKTKIEKELTEEEVIRREIAPKAKVDDKKVQEFYEKHKKDFTKPDLYDTSHIFVALPNPKSEGKADNPQDQKKADRLMAMIDEASRDSIRKALAELKAGKDFTATAKKYSEDEDTKNKGGALGPLSLKNMPPAMAEATAKLKIGGISDILKSEFGYHIIKLTGKTPSQQVEFKEVKPDIMNHLLREDVQSLRKTYLEQLKKNSNIKIHL
jgi:parvulin-like peptidyl-prolyl isomerase